MDRGPGRRRRAPCHRIFRDKSGDQSFPGERNVAALIDKKTAVILKADSGYLPLSWRGLSVRSNGLLVRGQPSHGLTEMRAANLRAYCSL